jgi:hypothetical protein
MLSFSNKTRENPTPIADEQSHPLWLSFHTKLRYPHLSGLGTELCSSQDGNKARFYHFVDSMLVTVYIKEALFSGNKFVKEQ